MKLLFLITQLRDVCPARESAEMSVKHHQQPTPAVLLEKVDSAFTVSQLEGDGGFSGQISHGELPVRRLRPSFDAMGDFGKPGHTIRRRARNFPGMGADPLSLNLKIEITVRAPMFPRSLLRAF
jgi:hypothetical protein